MKQKHMGLHPPLSAPLDSRFFRATRWGPDTLALARPQRLPLAEPLVGEMTQRLKYAHAWRLISSATQVRRSTERG